MSKVAVVYWSGTGNTEAMAHAVVEGIKEAGSEAELIQAADFDATRVMDFDAFAFGCSDQGDEELEETEFEPMFADVELMLDGERVLLFGSYGEWNAGEWMIDWKERTEKAGATVVDTCIAVEAPSEEELAECRRVGALIAG